MEIVNTFYYFFPDDIQKMFNIPIFFDLSHKTPIIFAQFLQNIFVHNFNSFLYAYIYADSLQKSFIFPIKQVIIYS